MDLAYYVALLATPAAAALLAAGLLAAVPLSGVLARRWSTARGPLVVALAATAVVVAATAPISAGFGLSMIGETLDVGRAFSWVQQGWPSPLMLLTSLEAALNLSLFATAAFAWVWTGRRARRVLAAHVLWSIGIETLQSIGGQRVADPRDLITNVLGALAGCALGALGVALRAHGAAGLGRRAQAWLGRPRHAVLAAALAIAMAAGVAVTVRDVQQSADGTLARALTDIRVAYQDVTWAEVDAAVDDGGETNAFSELLDRSTTRADSLRRLPGSDSYEARFPAGTELAPRCVLVLWAPDDVTFRTAAGSPCTNFLG